MWASNKSKKPTMREFTKFDSKKLPKEIDDLNLGEKMKNYTEINEIYDFFHKNVMEVINNNAPIKKQAKVEIT